MALCDQGAMTVSLLRLGVNDPDTIQDEQGPKRVGYTILL